MTKKGYIGVPSSNGEGIASKQIKKMYIPINGISKKIRKAYIGTTNGSKLWFQAPAKYKKYNVNGTYYWKQYQSKPVITYKDINLSHTSGTSTKFHVNAKNSEPNTRWYKNNAYFYAPEDGTSAYNLTVNTWVPHPNASVSSYNNVVFGDVVLISNISLSNGQYTFYYNKQASITGYSPGTYVKMVSSTNKNSYPNDGWDTSYPSSGYFIFDHADYIKGNYITTIDAMDGDYPDDGVAEDGYWYERVLE